MSAAPHELEVFATIGDTQVKIPSIAFIGGRAFEMSWGMVVVAPDEDRVDLHRSSGDCKVMVQDSMGERIVQTVSSLEPGSDHLRYYLGRNSELILNSSSGEIVHVKRRLESNNSLSSDPVS